MIENVMINFTLLAKHETGFDFGARLSLNPTTTAGLSHVSADETDAILLDIRFEL